VRLLQSRPHHLRNDDPGGTPLSTQLAFPRAQGRGYDRSSLLAENIEVEKSKIPEEWQPESADFLIKLLIKNPHLRLGRYGSF
jgi:hypothetical protein